MTPRGAPGGGPVVGPYVGEQPKTLAVDFPGTGSGQVPDRGHDRLGNDQTCTSPTTLQRFDAELRRWDAHSNRERRVGLCRLDSTARCDVLGTTTHLQLQHRKQRPNDHGNLQHSPAGCDAVDVDSDELVDHGERDRRRSSDGAGQGRRRQQPDDGRSDGHDHQAVGDGLDRVGHRQRQRHVHGDGDRADRDRLRRVRRALSAATRSRAAAPSDARRR